MASITNVRELSELAYGFIASKVLFSALNARVFDRLADGPRSIDALAATTGIAGHRLDTLLTACVSIGLVERRRNAFVNAPASQQYLVSSSPQYFGDYFRFQIDRHLYPLLENLDQALRGEAGTSLYDVMDDPTEAEHFSRAQHVGSLGPAPVVKRMVDLAGARRLLDVAGGSGAFSITLCQEYPELRATILDFPTVEPLATRYAGEANLTERIGFLGGDALEVSWPDEQDAVLLSYLLSAVSANRFPSLLERAQGALRPGGQLLVHDFFVDDDRRGPSGAALWFVPFLFNREAVSFTPADITRLAEAAGFIDVATRDVVPGLTRLLTAHKDAPSA